MVVAAFSESFSCPAVVSPSACAVSSFCPSVSLLCSCCRVSVFPSVPLFFSCCVPGSFSVFPVLPPHSDFLPAAGRRSYCRWHGSSHNRYSRLRSPDGILPPAVLSDKRRADTSFQSSSTVLLSSASYFPLHKKSPACTTDTLPVPSPCRHPRGSAAHALPVTASGTDIPAPQDTRPDRRIIPILLPL